MFLARKVYEIMKKYVSEEDAQVLAEIIEELERGKAVTSEEHQKSIYELKLQIEKTRAELLKRIEEVRAELIEKIDNNRVEIEKTRAELTKRIEEVRAELTEKIEASRTSLLKWLIGLIAGQTLTIAGLIIAFLRFLK